MALHHAMHCVVHHVVQQGVTSELSLQAQVPRSPDYWLDVRDPCAAHAGAAWTMEVSATAGSGLPLDACSIAQLSQHETLELTGHITAGRPLRHHNRMLM